MEMDGALIQHVKSLREYMYNDATIYLKRKYDSCYKIYVNTERD